MIDWISARGSSVGAYVDAASHRHTQTQYGLGGSAAGRSVGGGGGYALVGTVPVFRKVVRPAYRLRALAGGRAGRFPGGPGTWPARRWTAAASPSCASSCARSANSARRSDRSWKRTGTRGLHQPQARAAQPSPALPSRGHLGMVAGPRGGGPRVRPAERGPPRPGPHRQAHRLRARRSDPAAWHAAVHALTRELKEPVGRRRGGLREHRLDGRGPEGVRVHRGPRPGVPPARPVALVPPGTTFHLTPLEADYAYT